LAAIRAFLDWLVTGGILPFNPAAAVRGPKHSTKRGKTTVLSGAEARRILDTIADTTPAGLPDLAGLRDRALIGLMVYSFARISAAVGMRVDDVYEQQSRLWVRLHEKGGKRHDMPCHHNLEIYLRAYLARTGLAGQPKAFLFPTVLRGTGQLGTTALPRENAYAMVQRRATAAGITTKVGNHTFRATGVTAYLKNGGSLENAAAMANHASTRTTQLYDRRRDEMSLDEVERISI
jgi:integrase